MQQLLAAEDCVRPLPHREFQSSESPTPTSHDQLVCRDPQTILHPQLLPPELQMLSLEAESVAVTPIHAHTLGKTGTIPK